MNSEMRQAVMGGGCFWCIEAMFQKINGVALVESGYSAGKTLNPTYEAICSGTTQHAEVCRITFDPKVLSYSNLVQLFFMAHDPT